MPFHNVTNSRKLHGRPIFVGKAQTCIGQPRPSYTYCLPSPGPSGSRPDEGSLSLPVGLIIQVLTDISVTWSLPSYTTWGLRRASHPQGLTSPFWMSPSGVSNVAGVSVPRPHPPRSGFHAGCAEESKGPAELRGEGDQAAGEEVV